MTRRCLILCGLVFVLIAGAIPAGADDVTLLRAREGAAALLRGQYDKAVTAYNEALTNPEIADFVKSSIYSDRGVAKWRLKQTKEAVDDFNQSIQISPENASVYNNRGNALMDLGHPDEAVKDFDRAIALSPNYGAAYNNRGNAHAALSQYEPAFQDYRRAVELMPTSAVALNGRGKAHAALQRYHAAVRDYSRALALNTKYDAAYENRGEARLALEQYGGAAEDFTQVLATKPDQPDVLLLRAQAYAADKKYNTAVEDLSKAITLKPDLADAYIERGEVYTQVRRLPDAIADFTRAIELAPQNPKAYAMRAEARMKAAPPKKPEPATTVAKQPAAPPIRTLPHPARSPLPIRMPLYPARRQPIQMPRFLPSIRMPRSLRSIRTRFLLATAARLPIRTPRQFLPIQMLFQARRPRPLIRTQQWLLPIRMPLRLARPRPPIQTPRLLLLIRMPAVPPIRSCRTAAADPNAAAPADPNAAPGTEAAAPVVQPDDEALKDVQQALAIAPDDPVALRLRGDFYQATGKTAEAIADYQAALAKDPFQSESRDALEKLGQEVPPEQGQPLGEPVADWVVTEPSPGRYVATNPKYKKLRAELEMFGAGKPKIIEWSQMKDSLAGIGLLRYAAGGLGEGTEQELVYTAVIDLYANKVVSIEPYSWGTNTAKWDWQAYSVVVTDPDGNTNELKLRKPKNAAGRARRRRLLRGPLGWPGGGQPKAADAAAEAAAEEAAAAALRLVPLERSPDPI